MNRACPMLAGRRKSWKGKSGARNRGFSRNKSAGSGSLATFDHLERAPVLCDPIGGQYPAPINVRVDCRIPADDAARVQHRIATDISAIPQQGAELPQTGIDSL